MGIEIHTAEPTPEIRKHAERLREETSIDPETAAAHIGKLIGHVGNQVLASISSTGNPVADRREIDRLVKENHEGPYVVRYIEPKRSEA